MIVAGALALSCATAQATIEAGAPADSPAAQLAPEAGLADPGPALKPPAAAGENVNGAARTERVAVQAEPWQPVIVFSEPAPPPGAPNRFAESVLFGAKTGLLPLYFCTQAACPPPALGVTAAIAGIGVLAGAIVGMGRELIAQVQGEPPPPPGFAPQEIRAATPALVNATLESLGRGAFPACVLKQLAPSGESQQPLAWHAPKRRALVVPAAGAARADYDYAVETQLAQVTFLPAAPSGHPADRVPARLMVQTRTRFVDLKDDSSMDIASTWWSAPRPLDEWAFEDGAAVRESLVAACEGLATALYVRAANAWRTR